MCRNGLSPSNDEPIQTAQIAPDDVLALAADVEHAAAEGERDREPGEDQRRRDDQRLLQVDAAARLGVVDVPGNQTVASLKGRPIGSSDLEEPETRRPRRSRWYVVSGFFPVVTSTTRPPMRKARTRVSSGARSPPARCARP